MHLILIRHGRPHHVHDDPAGADPGLTAEGEHQAQALAALFATGQLGPVDAIVSSAMRRARETAAPLAQVLGLPLVTDERLVELDRGWPTYGLDFDSYPSRADAFAALNSGSFENHRYDPAAFVQRVTEGVEDHLRRLGDGVLAVVCHGGVISAYLAAVIGLAAPLFFIPYYTSLSRVLVLDDGHREMMSANETPHLLGQGA